jgi:glycosyltransferase involved in cell wall biosynthesis
MKVSVIIPVYNKESFVRRCLTQALSQDFDDYEVIVVDDGSKDKSGIVCDEIARQDNRLRVFHTENGGVTAARLRGVQEAQAEFVMFCDSDDELLPCALRNAYQATQTYQADEVIAPYQNQRGVLYDSGRRGLVSPIDIAKEFMALHNSIPPIWGILFRRSIVLDECLEIPRDIYLGEDILFHMRYLMKAKRICCISQSSYKYYDGLTTYPEINLAYEKRYDELMESSLQPMWPDIEPYFRLRQLKVYEKFIDKRKFHVYADYYYQLKGRIGKQVPLADRLVFSLPPRLAYFFVHWYKCWLAHKSSNQ